MRQMRSLDLAHMGSRKMIILIHNFTREKLPRRKLA